MLLVKKEVFIPTTEQKMIFGHMGYAAYKLWNVGNYEKLNYKKLGMTVFPNWYDQKKRLKDNFFYKNLPSQTAQYVLQQLQEAWNSFFTLKKTGGVINPKPPRFKHQNMSITFLKDAIVQTPSCVRLSIPMQLKQYLKSQGTDANYIYLKTKRFSDIHIKELQIKFDKKSYTAIAVYEIPDVISKSDNGHILSIDLGINNNFTCYDSDGKTFISTNLLNITHYFDKEIAHLQTISDRQQNAQGIQYPKKTKRELSLYRKKKNSVDDYVHKATRYIVDYCIQNHIHIIVIGDITNIRRNKDIGRSNQQLHSFPFYKIYQKLEYKAKLAGINFIKIKESYSSQCPPDSINVSKKYAAKQNRIQRGLYICDKNIFNADCVGAHNILRLYLDTIKKDYPTYKMLSNPLKVAV